MRRLGEKVEVNAQLVSTETGARVWADRFDDDRSNLGQIRVDIVSRLANSYGMELVKATVGPILELRPLFEQYQRETS